MPVAYAVARLQPLGLEVAGGGCSLVGVDVKQVYAKAVWYGVGQHRGVALQVLALKTHVQCRKGDVCCIARTRQRAGGLTQAQLGRQVAHQVDATRGNELLDGLDRRAAVAVNECEVVNTNMGDAPGQFAGVLAQAYGLGHDVAGCQQGPLAADRKSVRWDGELDAKGAAVQQGGAVQEAAGAMDVEAEVFAAGTCQQIQIDGAFDSDMPGGEGAHGQVQAGANPDALAGRVWLGCVQAAVG